MAILSNTIVQGSFRCLHKMYIGDLTVTGTTDFTSLSAGSLTVSGNSSFNTLTATGTATFSKAQDLSGTSDNSPALIVGTQSGIHLEFDADEIHAKSNGTSVGNLHINSEGGTVYLSNSDKISANNGAMSADTFSATGNIVSQGNVICDMLRARSYDLQNAYVNSGGLLIIGPTVFFPTVSTSAAKIQVTKSGDTLTLAITDPSITSAEMSGITWTSGSRVKCSANINGTPTDTMDGTISSINTSSHILTLSLTGGNIANIEAGTYAAVQYDHLAVMVYKRKDGSTEYPVGIEINCYDASNNSCTIRMNSGSSAQPTVLLGNLTNASLPQINGVTPSGYGLFSDNVFLQGIISASGGLIGDWSISQKGLYYTSDVPGSTSITFIPTGTTASSTSIGGSSGSKTWAMTVKDLFGIDTNGNMYVKGGKIAGWTINDKAFYNGTNGTTSTTEGIYLGTDGIRNYKNANTYVNIKDGIITAKGVDLTGSITATSGVIGGCTISNGLLQVDAAKITGTLTASQIGTGAITADKILAGAVTADKITVGMGGNLYANYDTFSNIADDTLYYLKDDHVTATIVENTSSIKYAYYGFQCAKLETDASGTDGYIYFGSAVTNYGCVSVQAGKKYRVSAYVKSNKADTSVELYVVGHATISDANSQHSEPASATVGQAWTRIETTYTAVAAYPYISVRVDLNKASTILYVDAIQIEEVATNDQVASPFKPASPTMIDGESVVASEFSLYYGASSIPIIRLDNLMITGNTKKMDLFIGSAYNYMQIDETQDVLKLSSNGTLSIESTDGTKIYGSAKAQDDQAKFAELVRGGMTLSPNVAASLVQNAVYMAIMWHNFSTAARGVYLVRNGTVFPIVNGSEITFTGMGSTTTFTWANTGSNTSTCYFMRLSG